MPSHLPQYTLRISKNTMEKLRYIAERSGRSANKEFVQVIFWHIEKWER